MCFQNGNDVIIGSYSVIDMAQPVLSFVIVTK